MKKSLIALAVAGAMTAPIVAQADATLYGGVETRLKFVEDQDADLFVDKAEMGVKGSSELENLSGTKATYQIEFRIDGNGVDGSALDNNINNNNSSGVNMRKANVGLVGGFGIVQIGRQNNLGAAVKKTDIFMSQQQNYLTSDRFGNAIYYVTPMFSGFEAYAGMIMDGQGDDNQKDVDAWQAGFNYSLMGLDLSVAYTSVRDQYVDFVEGDTGFDDFTTTGVGAGYSFGDFTVLATYERLKNDNFPTDGDDYKDETWGLAGLYNLGNLTLKAGYSDSYVDNHNNAAFEFDADAGAEVFVPQRGANDYRGYALQAAYALGQKASVKAEWSRQDFKKSTYGDDKTDIVTLSYAVAF